MPKRDPLDPAGPYSAFENVRKILGEYRSSKTGPSIREASETSDELRKELYQKGLKGFKRGGKVRKTGPAKLHKGEVVLKASAAKKLGAAKLRAANRPTRRKR